MSYPFFDCTICANRVQKVVYCVPGSLPSISCMNRNSKLSTAFDDEASFAHHCRGQGSHYNTRHEPPLLYRGDSMSVHYNFSGFFSGTCCFCALHSGFGPGIFAQMGCSNCVRKESIRQEFAKLVGHPSSDSAIASSWASHGWRALPPVIIDHILVFATGLEDSNVTVHDGHVVISI